MTEFRHELKHEIGAPELLALRQRLSAVLTPDRHSDSGRYTVRSLYFDDARDSALREKLPPSAPCSPARAGSLQGRSLRSCTPA